MTDPSELPACCPGCGLVILSGALFDASARSDEFGPILGIHSDAEPQSGAGYVGIGSAWLYDQSPDLYACPRCGRDPVSGSDVGDR